MDGRYSRAGNGTGKQNTAYRSAHPPFPAFFAAGADRPLTV
jgi:hypothetical protein